MNKSWDILPSVDILKECLRVLKSGAWAMWREVTGHDKHRSKERNDYSKDNFEWEKKDIPTSPDSRMKY